MVKVLGLCWYKVLSNVKKCIIFFDGWLKIFEINIFLIFWKCCFLVLIFLLGFVLGFDVVFNLLIIFCWIRVNGWGDEGKCNRWCKIFEVFLLIDCVLFVM